MSPDRSTTKDALIADRSALGVRNNPVFDSQLRHRRSWDADAEDLPRGLRRHDVRQAARHPQHIMTILDINGQTAVVVRPTTSLFEGVRARPCGADSLTDLRLPHPSAAAHWDLLRPRRQGQRALLRQSPPGPEPAVDRERLWVCRPAHQQALHLKQNPFRRADLDEFVRRTYKARSGRARANGR